MVYLKTPILERRIEQEMIEGLSIFIYRKLKQKKYIKYEDLEKRYEDRNEYRGKVNAVEMARHNAIDANFDSDIYRIYYGSDEDFNRHLDEEKYKISFGSSWRDTLNNAIFVYKTFDWENNIILICGG